LRDFQAEGESPAGGLFHAAAFSTALLPTNSATEPDKGTFVDPIQYPLGIEYVFINGIPVVQAGDYEKKLAGNVLRKSGKRAGGRS
jgi:hypothetical protein